MDDKTLEKALGGFYRRIAANQEPLGAEFQKVLDDNWWELLIDDNHGEKSSGDLHDNVLLHAMTPREDKKD